MPNEITRERRGNSPPPICAGISIIILSDLRTYELDHSSLNLTVRLRRYGHDEVTVFPHMLFAHASWSECDHHLFLTRLCTQEIGDPRRRLEAGTGELDGGDGATLRGERWAGGSGHGDLRTECGILSAERTTGRRG